MKANLNPWTGLYPVPGLGPSTAGYPVPGPGPSSTSTTAGYHPVPEAEPRARAGSETGLEDHLVSPTTFRKEKFLIGKNSSEFHWLG